MKKNLISLLISVLCTVLSCCLVACSNINNFGSELDNLHQANDSDTPKANNFEQIVIEPANGYVFEDISKGYELASLTVNTSGTGGYYFVLDPICLYQEDASEYFELKAELDAKYRYIKFYARSESLVEIEVPLGEYEIYYATGKNWCGEDELFGENTVYVKCDGTFSFFRDGSDVVGWKLELTPITNGNLDTDTIDASDFPK